MGHLGMGSPPPSKFMEMIVSRLQFLSIEMLHNMAAGFPQGKPFKRENEKERQIIATVF